MNIEYIFENLRNIKIDDMHYGHSIKCRYYLDGIFTIQSSVGRSIDSPFFKCINIADVNIEKIFGILRNNKYMLCLLYITDIQIATLSM